MAKFPANISVDYDTSTMPPTLTFEGDWKSPIAVGDEVAYTLTPKPGCSFTFQNLTLSFSTEPSSQAAQVFGPSGAVAQTAHGVDQVSIEKIFIDPVSLKFTVKNGSTANEDITLSVEIMVQDGQTGKLYESQDPQIILDPET